MGVAQTLLLRLRANASEARRLRDELHAWLRSAGINGSTGAEIAVAVNEAFLNAVEHPLQRRSDEIVVRGGVFARHVVVHVHDEGEWQEEVDPSREHYGQQLMAVLMDRVHVERTRGGTTVTLRKMLPRAGRG